MPNWLKWELRGYVSDEDAKSILSASRVRLVAIPRKNMAPLPWADDYDVRSTADALKPSIVKWKLWAYNISLLIPMTAFS